MSSTTIDLHDADGKPLGLRVTLPSEHGPIVVLSNKFAAQDHYSEQFCHHRYFLRNDDGGYREIRPFFVTQPPCYVERTEQPS